jgi:hypothetical protein
MERLNKTLVGRGEEEVWSDAKHVIPPLGTQSFLLL